MTIKDAHYLSMAFGYLYEGEVDALTVLALQLPDNPSVVNLGAGAGTSALCFLQARPDLHLTTVDINADGPLGSIKGERNALEGYGFVEWFRYKAILGDSKVVGAEYDGPPLDMVFVDGDHSKAGCRGDVHAWLPHIKEGGVIAFHDYAALNWQDVIDVVDEEMAGYEMAIQVDTVIAFWV